MKKNVMFCILLFILIERTAIMRFGYNKPFLQLQQNETEPIEYEIRSAGEPIQYYIGD